MPKNFAFTLRCRLVSRNRCSRHMSTMSCHPEWHGGQDEPFQAKIYQINEPALYRLLVVERAAEREVDHGGGLARPLARVAPGRAFG